MRKLAELRERIRILATRRTVWGDGDDVHVDRESWSSAWAIAGVHAWEWRWVRHYGAMACGCTRNPVTRRIVLVDMACEEHGGGVGASVGRVE